ncbi:cation-translocating P-type ATPase [Sphingobium sp. TCM1]|uniref:cation-translocating P-type ATPase n=1 Tax=Sphingobium sp. TCM1 TaxID=453246 RepID=UPI0007F4ABCF|nr:cation-translocating P-type ATPase [Sphingobium sp. TCM1]OAN53340.1 ATPase [Sphingobium sp. TCM1]
MPTATDQRPTAPSRSGLTATEARRRFDAQGPNELPRTGRRTVPHILAEVVREPMLALLLAGGVAYMLLGDLGEALILLGFATFSIGITVIQESRTEHVLEALRDLSAPRALVIRDGTRIRIAGREVVEGDLLVLEQGDRVAADAMLVSADDLQADESLLTGESVPVRKQPALQGEELLQRRPGGEDQPLVYSGSLITRGSGLALAIATGPRSEIGKIGQSLSTLDAEPPRLRRETARIVRLCAIGGGFVALLVVLLFGLLRGGWIDALLAGIAIGMSMLPEEFPVVLTIFLAMGAWRIAQAGVLTRRAAAIETLGSATILCTDKTGTLTENRMAVTELWLASGEIGAVDGMTVLSPRFHELLDASILASAPVPVDPMEVAFHQTGAAIPELAKRRAGLSLAHSYGLRPELLAMTNVWETSDPEAACTVAAKGAPEAIAALCHLSSAERSRLETAVDTMAQRGMRVLGVATASTSPGSALPESQQNYDFALIGLIGLADPLRASVPAAVAECRSAGIKVVMITGDYAATARTIATQAGIMDGDVLTGTDLAALDDAALAERLKTVTVFARIMPEQKLRIVTAYKAEGEIVAMTGDGVNDAPSLKAAHIGIAMGKRGTDVAREASAIVLLDDDFGSIVKAVRLGRRIYDNIRKAMAFIFAVHVPIAGLALLPLASGLPILFGPIHIALLEMIIDPVCALVFEAEREEQDLMNRKPRHPEERLFSLRMIGWSVFQGGLGFALLATIFLASSYAGMAEADARALTFFSLIGVILVLILVNRSFDTSLLHALVRGNAALRYVLGAVVAVAAVVMTVPALRSLLKFGPLHGPDVAITMGSAALLLILLEASKMVQLRRASRFARQART